MKKLTALLLALVMVLAMSATAFAAVLDTAADNYGKVTTNEKELTIPTTIVITNEEGAAAKDKQVAYKAMTFKHTVVVPTVATDSTVTDEHSNVGYVKAGVTDGLKVKTENAAPAGVVTLDANGQATITASTTFVVDTDKFSSAGIYRYQINDISDTDTETKDALEAAGVVKGASTDSDYFLDVYLINDDANPGKVKVSGYVLTAKNNQTIEAGTNEPDAEKKPGFGTDPTTAGPYPVDKNYTYPTYNVILNKAVKGSMGDKQHGFPFTVTVTNNGLNYDYEITGSTNIALNAALVNNTTIGTVNLGDGSTLKIWGLSPFATVNYSEENDLPETYKTKVGNSAAAADVKAEADLAQNATMAAFDSAKIVTTGYAIDTKATVNAEADAIYYTNTLTDVSQTGVVLRFAPYALMLGAGVALFIILKVRKNKAVEEA